jgi:hypothetical protein
MSLAWILFLSGAELEKFRLDPNPIPLVWVKFDVPVFVKPFNGIDLPIMLLKRSSVPNSSFMPGG